MSIGEFPPKSAHFLHKTFKMQRIFPCLRHQAPHAPKKSHVPLETMSKGTRSWVWAIGQRGLAPIKRTETGTLCW